MQTGYISDRISAYKKLLTAIFSGVICYLLVLSSYLQEKILLFSSFVLAVIFGFVLLLYYKEILHPIEKIKENDKKITDNELLSPEDTHLLWSEENANLILYLRRETDKKEMMRLAIESSKYIALQRQINPHFLYNALEGIRFELLLNGQRQTANMVEALSNYFSYSISALDQLGSLEEELQNVDDFFEIEKFRFGDRVNLEKKIDLDSNILQELQIPRMTLQPLVENAIQHGLENKEDSGIVTLYVYRTEKNIVCKIIDNGNGMTEEQLASINRRLEDASFEQRDGKKKHGIALKNVNTRIKRLFRHHCG